MRQVQFLTCAFKVVGVCRLVCRRVIFMLFIGLNYGCLWRFNEGFLCHRRFLVWTWTVCGSITLCWFDGCLWDGNPRLAPYYRWLGLGRHCWGTPSIGQSWRGQWCPKLISRRFGPRWNQWWWNLGFRRYRGWPRLGRDGWGLLWCWRNKWLGRWAGRYLGWNREGWVSAGPSHGRLGKWLGGFLWSLLQRGWLHTFSSYCFWKLKKKNIRKIFMTENCSLLYNRENKLWFVLILANGDHTCIHTKIGVWFFHMCNQIRVTDLED